MSDREIHNEGSREPSGEDDWGKAQQRLIFYLQSLKIPPFEVLELALDALRMAREELDGAEKGQTPVTASMRILRRLLSSRRPTGKLKAEMGQKMLSLPYAGEKDLCRGIRSMPPLTRGTMLPERVRKRSSSHPNSPTAPS